MNEIEQMQERYRALWRALGYETPRWAIETAARHDGNCHLEFNDGQYQYIATEHGAILDVCSTPDAGAMIEWLADELAGSLAREAVAREGIAFGDPRWRTRWREHQIAALEKLDPEWARRRKDELG